MSFLTQRFANTFPIRSTVRKDESSMGQKVFSLFSDLSESMLIDIVKLTNSFTLYNDDLEVSKIYKINLLEEDKVKADENNEILYTFPTVYGYLNKQKIELKRVEGSDGFLYGLPSRYTKVNEVEYTEDLIYSDEPNGKYSTNYVNGEWFYKQDFDINERLHIRVRGSKLYKKVSDGTEVIPSSQLPYGGFTYIRLEGRDKFFNKIEEYIKVNRDGEYSSKKIFRRLEKIEKDGFDGSIEVRLSEATVVPYSSLTTENIRKKNKFKIASNKIKSGICELELSSEEVEFESGIETIWYLDIYSRFVLTERDVKRGGNVEESILRSKIAGILLVDENMDFYNPIDFFVSSINSRIYILDDQGRIHISSLNLSPFIENGERRSYEITLETKLLTQRVPYGKDVRAKCELKKTIDVVKFWEIKLVSPSGKIYFLKYDYNPNTFNKSLLWLDETQHNGSYKNEPLVDDSRKLIDLPVFNWNDFSFKINCDEIGQWNLYTYAYYDNQTYTHKTSFICEFLKPEKTIKTGLSNPKGLFLSEGNKVVVKTDSKFIYYQENFDSYMADIINNRLLFRDEYDEIEVIYD